MTRARETYKDIARKKIFWISVAVIFLALLFIIDVSTGPAWLSPKEIFSAIFTTTDGHLSQNEIIIKVIRLPVAVMALVVGACLGVAGAQMQTVLDNPLASPYTLGISSAASFGAALGIVLGKSALPGREIFVVPLSAFLFSMLSLLLVYVISRTRNGSGQTVVLAGVALSFLFNSLVSLLQYFSKDDQFEAIVLWMFGSLQGASWTKVMLITATLAVCMPILLSDSWKLTALQLGDNKAKSMGIHTGRLRLKVITIAAVLTSISVCFVGAIGFVGLVAPHIARSFVGEDQRFFLPCAALTGAVILSFASIAGKTIIPGAIFPIGITTSLIGVPFLITIILRQKKTI